jgi:uncharacterized protein (UPF0276 family)
MTCATNAAAAMPKSAGIGLKAPHYRQILDSLPRVAFFEIHAENFMGAGGPPHRYLSAIREHYPLSVHGVGLSLGSTAPLDLDHLDALARVVDRYQPELVSEHLAWCSVDGTYLNDLLPIPYTKAMLRHFAQRVAQVQDRLGRTILIENPSAYYAYATSAIPEPDFLAELVAATGCGILLDVNNVYVSGRNLGFDPWAYVDAIPAEAVGEIHLAGHHLRRFEDGAEIRIDDHGSKVIEDVWALYRHAVRRCGPQPTLIEWDTEVPPLDILVGEASRADAEAEAATAARGGLDAACA